MPPTITRIETVEFTYPVEDAGNNPKGFDMVYRPGNTHERTT